MKKLLLFVLLCTVTLNHETLNAQKGWNKTKSNNKLVYTPSSIKQDKTFSYRFSQPVDLNGKQEKEWLLANAKKEQSKLGKAESPWKLKQEKTGGWSVSNMYSNSKGKKMSTGYVSKTLANVKVYMIQMISSFDLGTLLRYGKQIDIVKADAEEVFGQSNGLATIPTKQKKKTTTYAARKSSATSKNSKLTGKEKRRMIEQQIRTSPGNGVRPNQIQVLWVDSGIDVLRGGISVNTYLLLKDGSVYTDCEIPPNELLVQKSKELQPKKWTVWRKSGMTYQIKSKKKGIWKALKGTKAIETKSNEKINKKFISTGGSQYRGSWKNTIIFKPNGRFEMSRFSMKDNSSLGGGNTGPSVHTVRKSDKTGTRGTTTVGGNGIGGGTSVQKNNAAANTGTYFLKGNTVTLKHDNGYTHTELFFFDKADKTSFIYKDNRFWVKK